jgi:hypothetical protein
MTRPPAIGVLAVLQLLAGAFWAMVGTTLVLVMATKPRAAEADTVTPIIIAVCIGLAAYQITCGVGLWRLRGYGRTMQMIGAAIGLLGIPIGTIISIVILVYLSKPGVKVLFSGKTADELTPEETAAVHGLSSGGAGAIIIALVSVVVGVFFVGIIAAIAIPGLLRARIAGNEASAIGTLRAISTAETAYAAANGGYYDSQECLVNPSNCLPDFRGGAFLADVYRTKSGFRFDLAGTPAPSARDAKTSRTSLSDFVVIATPLSPSTGTRVFCVDHVGVVRWQSAQGELPQGIAACPASWAALE